jgi:hypothetical protein
MSSFGNCVQYHFTHIPPDEYGWSDIERSSYPAKGGKKLSSIRDVVAKLFIAIITNSAFRRGCNEEHTKGGILAYLLIDCALGAGEYVLFS